MRSGSVVVHRQCFVGAAWRVLGAVVVAALLASLAAAQVPELSALPRLAPFAVTGAVPPSPWFVMGLPAQRKKPLTRFDVVSLEGQRVLRVEADGSYGNLVHPVIGDDAPRWLTWRWRVDEPLPDADIRERGREDIALRVCATFDLPLAAVPFVERQLLRAGRLASSEALPAAAVCYVWDSRLAPGTVLASPFTRRIRILVLRGPEAPLHGWQAERRDVAADFLALFADESRAVPPLAAIAIGADADNTHGHSVAHVAEVELR